MKNIVVLIAALLFISHFGFSQETYYTRNATLVLGSVIDNQVLEFRTTELGVVLDYETAKIKIRFPIKSLQCGIDSLDEKIKNNSLEVIFDAQLGLEYIKTNEHPPLEFTTEGWLTIGESKTKLRGEGELHHIGNSPELSCMLGLRFYIEFRDLSIEPPFPGMANEFEAVITQALLERAKY